MHQFDNVQSLFLVLFLVQNSTISKLFKVAVSYVPLSSALLTGELHVDPAGFGAKAWHKLFIIVIIPLTAVSFREPFAAMPLDGCFDSLKHCVGRQLRYKYNTPVFPPTVYTGMKSTCLCVALLVSVHTP